MSGASASPEKVGAQRDAVLQKRVMVRGRALRRHACTPSFARTKAVARMRNAELANSSVQPAPEDGRGCRLALAGFP